MKQKDEWAIYTTASKKYGGDSWAITNKVINGFTTEELAKVAMKIIDDANRHTFDVYKSVVIKIKEAD
jgi:hypothetical protein